MGAATDCGRSGQGSFYHPRAPRASPMYRLFESHFDEFERVYAERDQKRYGFWRPAIRKSVDAFLACGDLHEGFARARCADCGAEFFVAFSCKQRCMCASCHQKRTLLTGLHISENVCASVFQRGCGGGRFDAAEPQGHADEVGRVDPAGVRSGPANTAVAK